MQVLVRFKLSSMAYAYHHDLHAYMCDRPPHVLLLSGRPQFHVHSEPDKALLDFYRFSESTCYDSHFPCIMQSGSAYVLEQSAISLLTKQASAGMIATVPTTLKLSHCCFIVWVGSPALVAQTRATSSFEQGIMG
jgi:hypothetical protein